MNAVDSAAMACQYGVTLSLLLFFVLFASASINMKPVLDGKKSNAEHRRGLGHADSLLQSLLIQAPVVTPYTAWSPHSIVTARRVLHDTILSCLPLDSGYGAVAVHDSNLTEEVSDAAAIC